MNSIDRLMAVFLTVVICGTIYMATREPVRQGDVIIGPVTAELVPVKPPPDASPDAGETEPMPVPVSWDVVAGLPGGAPAEWISDDGKHLPELLIWSKRPGSNTPHNLRLLHVVDGRQVLLGCGVDGPQQWCKTADRRDGAREVTVILGLSMSGERLRLRASDGVYWFRRGRVSAGLRDAR
jgi:hypothetical protein